MPAPISLRPVPVAVTAAVAAPVAMTSFRRRERRGWVKLLLAVASLALVVAAANAGQRAYDALAKRADPVAGSVIGRGGSGWFFLTKLVMSYEVDGERRATAVYISDDASDVKGARRYPIGASVQVLVDPTSPSRAALLGEASDSPGDFFLMSVGLLALLALAPAGVLQIARARRARARLRAQPWRTVKCAVDGVSRRVHQARRTRPVLRIVAGEQVTDLVVLRLQGTEAVRHALAGVTRVQIVGDPLRRVVVHVPGSTEAWIAARPHFGRVERRWNHDTKVRRINGVHPTVAAEPRWPSMVLIAGLWVAAAWAIIANPDFSSSDSFTVLDAADTRWSKALILVPLAVLATFNFSRQLRGRASPASRDGAPRVDLQRLRPNGPPTTPPNPPARPSDSLPEDIRPGWAAPVREHPPLPAAGRRREPASRD